AGDAESICTMRLSDVVRNPCVLSPIAALLDLEKIAEDDKGWTGLDDQLSALKESDSYLFESESQSQPTPVITAGGNPDGAPAGEKDAWAEVAARYQ
ncbi:hypothetical protein GMD33_13915, partial [Parasutterella excrementihominis]|uniref:phage scaffolding protein n=1 Tax=Parasutterella excrementihominis TaxID=487175 RepID=UPI0013561229